MFQSKITCIAGPSHTVRWREHIVNGVVECSISPDSLIGRGGAPIWSKWLLDQCLQKTGTEGEVGILVGDFRFGNAICLSVQQEDDVMMDGYLSIDQKAITPNNDALMLRRSLAALEIWNKRFGSRATLLFWDLFCREVIDRLAGRYIKGGAYRHPSWNLTDIQKAIPNLQAVDMGPLQRMPMHEVVRLFIDTSCHPSQIGYIFLDGVLGKFLPTIEAYRRAVDLVEYDLVCIAARILKARGCPTVLTGQSVWLDTLSRYMGVAGSVKLASAGLIIAPLNPAPGQPSIAEIVKNIDLSSCNILVMSDGGANLCVSLSVSFETSWEAWEDQPYFDWTGSVDTIILARGETSRFKYPAKNASQAINVNRCDITPDMVELGSTGEPSWAGLCHLLNQLAQPELPSTLATICMSDLKISNNDRSYKIHSEVLLSKNGIAYLIGGNHSILRYVSGELEPTSQSVENFCANIAGRVRHSESGDIRYAHVVFPDKQSVMDGDFPVKPVIRLGDVYLQQMKVGIRKHVLYPADMLKMETVAPYHTLDTHLNDTGSLSILRSMLAKVGLDANDKLDHVAANITRPMRSRGDLGSKLEPELYQDGLYLVPDWPIFEYSRRNGLNDGRIDILLSPEAQINDTVLLFGDSFFIMMLQHLSGIFKRVICLRTRFLHPEMLSLVRPGVIFTGNAERYLSNVTSDRNAHAFELYPYLSSSTEVEVDTSFLEAWRAVTSPESDFAHRFFTKLGCD